MNFDSYILSTLFEKSLIRLTADFTSDLGQKSAVSGLSKSLKSKVSSNEPSPYNFQLKRNEEGTYTLITPFVLYRDARLIIINLMKWIERNGRTERNHNLFIDLKFLDEQKGPFKGTLFSTSTKIENIDKIKFILEFDEKKIYQSFPNRRNGFFSKTILQFEPIQKFIPKERSAIDPRMYRISNTSNSGINFETLNSGFLRMQYIGGIEYEKGIESILNSLNQFCTTAWDCTINKGFTQENIKKFQKILKSKEKIRESYFDYLIFKKNFPKISLTIDLIDDPKVLYSFYQTIREGIFELLSNLKFSNEIELNYDTTASIFQIKDAKVDVKNISGVEFINCEISNGTFSKCDFYECKIFNSNLINCNLYLNSIANQCNLFNSYSNRTIELNDCIIEGMSGILNGKMKGGIFRNGKIGEYAQFSDETKIIQYQPMKIGYMVAGDKVIIPSKKFKEF